jgi:hypothetical protein
VVGGRPCVHQRDPQLLGPQRWGTKFNLNTGALIIAMI